MRSFPLTDVECGCHGLLSDIWVLAKYFLAVKKSMKQSRTSRHRKNKSHRKAKLPAFSLRSSTISILSSLSQHLLFIFLAIIASSGFCVCFFYSSMPKFLPFKTAFSIILIPVVPWNILWLLISTLIAAFCFLFEIPKRKISMGPSHFFKLYFGICHRPVYGLIFPGEGDCSCYNHLWLRGKGLQYTAHTQGPWEHCISLEGNIYGSLGE